MLFTLAQYIETIADSHGRTRTLGEIVPDRDDRGRIRFHIGNSSIVFRIFRDGRPMRLKCYTRPRRNLQTIYREKLLPQELYLFSAPRCGTWVDVVLDEWIEGPTLDRAIEEAAARNDRDALHRLSVRFDALAAELLAAPWAHGDLKPENIVCTEPELRLIDFDAQFLPELAGQPGSELGTAAYQHPARSTNDFDASIDDYPIALIATALHVLALDPSYYLRYAQRDGLLYDPAAILHRRDEAYDRSLDLLARHGEAAAYRIARLLTSPGIRLPGLARLLDRKRPEGTVPADKLVLDVRDGLWGYRYGTQFAIEPLFDSGFDFSEGSAAVRLGGYWHFIDPTGRIVLKCPDCEQVKPFRNGRASVIRNGRREELTLPEK